MRQLRIYLRAKETVPSRAFADNALGTMVRNCYLSLYLSTLLSHSSWKLNRVLTEEDGRSLSLATRKTLG